MRVREFQEIIEATYGAKDRGRELAETYLWFVEEVGELARAVNGRTSRANLEVEFADVFAWLSTLASITGVDLEAVAQARYGAGCPRCHASPCACDEVRQRPRAGAPGAPDEAKAATAADAAQASARSETEVTT